jgi:hypothetical protein
MLRRVALVKTDVSENLSSSFIRMKRIGELEQRYLHFPSPPNSCRDEKGMSGASELGQTRREHCWGLGVGLKTLSWDFIPEQQMAGLYYGE